MMQNNSKFWESLDELVANSEIVVDRPKGTVHPKYPNFIYRVDYGYLKDTSSMDGAGIDVWVGSGEKNEIDGRIVSSCVCVIIPNLTRNVRPYAFVENVVTHTDYRGRGYATDCLNYAKEIAKQMNCYKMMLLTGSKRETTFKFYRNAGYNSTDKTAFIQWIE